MIAGVKVESVKRIPNIKGDIFHGLRCSEEGFESFGEAYFSRVHNNEIKGWKKHTKMVLNLLVPVGVIKFVMYDDRPESETQGEFFEITLSPDNYHRLKIPADIWMSFQGLDDGINLLLNIASIEHDPTESVGCDLSEIPYSWN